MGESFAYLCASVYHSECVGVLFVDYIDIVNDPLSSGEYKEEEDPQLFKSQKTGRGPLSADWRTNPPNGIIMCSYKLCKVCMYAGMYLIVWKYIAQWNLISIHLNNIIMSKCKCYQIILRIYST